jgi:nicotinic acid mononucleotide adenylyltransferase
VELIASNIPMRHHPDHRRRLIARSAHLAPPKELLYASHWVGVMRRPGEQPNLEELERELPGISSKIHYVDAPLLEIASREIRSRIAMGNPSATISRFRVRIYRANIISINSPKSKSRNHKSKIVNRKSYMPSAL